MQEYLLHRVFVRELRFIPRAQMKGIEFARALSSLTEPRRYKRYQIAGAQHSPDTEASWRSNSHRMSDALYRDAREINGEIP
jgi:hypothetical protein